MIRDAGARIETGKPSNHGRRSLSISHRKGRAGSPNLPSHPAQPTAIDGFGDAVLPKQDGDGTANRPTHH